jgi:hypothetical protein
MSIIASYPHFFHTRPQLFYLSDSPFMTHLADTLFRIVLGVITIVVDLFSTG